MHVLRCGRAPTTSRAAPMPASGSVQERSCKRTGGEPVASEATSSRLVDCEATAREPTALADGQVSLSRTSGCVQHQRGGARDMERDPNPEAQARSTVPLVATAEERDHLSLAPGTDFEHYEIIRELGHGGMGRVFLARDT